MARTMKHTGIGIDYLIKRVEEYGDAQQIIAEDGEPLTAQDALEWLRSLQATGQWILTSSCPMPKPDGGCPGHVEEAASAKTEGRTI